MSLLLPFDLEGTPGKPVTSHQLPAGGQFKLVLVLDLLLLPLTNPLPARLNLYLA